MTHGRQKSRIERQMATLMILMAQNAVTCWYIGRFVPIFFCLSYYIGKTDGSSRVSPYPTCAYRPQNRAYQQYTENRKKLPSASHTHTKHSQWHSRTNKNCENVFNYYLLLQCYLLWMLNGQGLYVQFVRIRIYFCSASCAMHLHVA